MPDQTNEDSLSDTSFPDPSETTVPSIRVLDVRRRFGRQVVLDGVSFDIPPGEMLVVLGPSGSGKTTLLRLIAGLDRPDSGEILLKGQVSTGLQPQDRRLGVVFQEQALFQHMSVEENIAFGLRVRHVGREEVARKVETMLDLTRLGAHRHKVPSQLSGGQRQRVAVARALVIKPDAMLFDEPFSALDAVTRTELRREVRHTLKTVNLAAMFITHDQEEALELADRIVVLNEGKIEQIGTPFDVYNHPANEFVATFLGAANVLLGRYRGGKVMLGAMRLDPPDGIRPLEDGQPVKAIVRPEDLVLGFQPQFLDAAHFLGTGWIEDVSYIGPSERLIIQLKLRPLRAGEAGTSSTLLLVDESFSDTVPVIATRSKWDASEMQLSPGDRVVVGLKDYRVMPHYPLASEAGAKVYT